MHGSSRHFCIGVRSVSLVNFRTVKEDSQMKCPYCWAEKAYVRKANGWKDTLLRCLLLRLMRCHHCYRRFVVPWLSTSGKQTKMRPIQTGSSEKPVRVSHAAQRRTVKLGGVELDGVELDGVVSASQGRVLN